MHSQNPSGSRASRRKGLGCPGEEQDGCLPPPPRNAMFFLIVTLLPGMLFRCPSQATLYRLMPFTLQASLPPGRPLTLSLTLVHLIHTPRVLSTSPSQRAFLGVINAQSFVHTLCDDKPRGARTKTFLLVLVSPVPNTVPSS